MSCLGKTTDGIKAVCFWRLLKKRKKCSETSFQKWCSIEAYGLHRPVPLRISLHPVKGWAFGTDQLRVGCCQIWDMSNNATNFNELEILTLFSFLDRLESQVLCSHWDCHYNENAIKWVKICKQVSTTLIEKLNWLRKFPFFKLWNFLKAGQLF